MERTDYIEPREDNGSKMVEDILSHSNIKSRRYWVARLSDEHYWDVALKNNLWLMQQRYHIQANQIVTQLLNLVKEVKVGDVLLLTYTNQRIYAYGHVVKCPYNTEQISIMAESEDELTDKVEYEIIPLINEYINDGILNVKSEEKKLAFDSWRSLNTIPDVEDDEQDYDE